MSTRVALAIAVCAWGLGLGILAATIHHASGVGADQSSSVQDPGYLWGFVFIAIGFGVLYRTER